MAHFIIVPIKETANNYKLQIYYNNLTKIRPADFYQLIKAKYPRYMEDGSDEDILILNKRAKQSGRTVDNRNQRGIPHFYRTVPKVGRSGNIDTQHIRYRLKKLWPDADLTFTILDGN